jgi:transcriptional regulator with XRE-family HTH domain
MGRVARWRPVRLAEKLLAIREALNLSQNEIIGCMGLDGQIVQQHISAYECGLREPPLPVLLEYARVAAGGIDGAALYLEILVDDALDLPKRLPNSNPSIQRKRMPLSSSKKKT